MNSGKQMSALAAGTTHCPTLSRAMQQHPSQLWGVRSSPYLQGWPHMPLLLVCGLQEV
jgi:hypothetical protein